MRCRLGLNLRRRDNYVFFDPDAPIHLSLSAPINYTYRVTNSIIKALKVGKIIDIDNAIDINKGCFKNAQTPLLNPNELKKDVPPVNVKPNVTLPEKEPDNKQSDDNDPKNSKNKKGKANETPEK